MVSTCSCQSAYREWRGSVGGRGDSEGEEEGGSVPVCTQGLSHPGLQ